MAKINGYIVGKDNLNLRYLYTSNGDKLAKVNGYTFHGINLVKVNGYTFNGDNLAKENRHTYK